MATAVINQTSKQTENQIDWQFPNEKEAVSIDDFREMVRNSEKAPYISFEKFCEVTEEWLTK